MKVNLRLMKMVNESFQAWEIVVWVLVVEGAEVFVV